MEVNKKLICLLILCLCLSLFGYKQYYKKYNKNKILKESSNQTSCYLEYDYLNTSRKFEFKLDKERNVEIKAKCMAGSISVKIDNNEGEEFYRGTLDQDTFFSVKIEKGNGCTININGNKTVGYFSAKIAD